MNSWQDNRNQEVSFDPLAPYTESNILAIEPPRNQPAST